MSTSGLPGLVAAPAPAQALDKARTGRPVLVAFHEPGEQLLCLLAHLACQFHLLRQRFLAVLLDGLEECPLRSRSVGQRLGIAQRLQQDAIRIGARSTAPSDNTPWVM